MTRLATGVGAARWQRARRKLLRPTSAGTLGERSPVSPLPSPVSSVSTKVEVTKVGVSFGSALAIAISWSVHHSIVWAIIHGAFSWFYVLYYALKR